MNFDPIPFRVSIELGLWVTAILFVLCFPAAWIFARSTRPWTIWIESLGSLPLVLSPTVLGFYLLLLLSPKGPLGAFFLSTFGIRLAFSFPAIVIGSCVSSLPFMLGALKTGILAIPSHLLDASATLGKGRFETLFRIAIPNMKPAIFSGVVNTFAHTLGEFGVVLMIGGSIPGVTKVVSIAVYERVESLDFAGAQVYAIILVCASYAGVLALNLAQRRVGRR